jgi:hypothetical protein
MKEEPDSSFLESVFSVHLVPVPAAAADRIGRSSQLISPLAAAV